jgi:hypothetical protein
MPETSIRIDYGNRVFEASGTREDVDEYLERFASLLAEFQSHPATAVVDESSSPVPSEATPAEFGEYFHRFGDGLTDVDRVLLAGHFAQLSNGRGSFTTRDANELLVNQGVKVANASECVRRALGTRRVFGIGKGEYKVSAQGVEYIRSLMH